MIEEQLSDAERRRILALLIDAVPHTGRDRALTALIKKLSGTDTVVIVKRAYPSENRVSRGVLIDPADERRDE